MDFDPRVLRSMVRASAMVLEMGILVVGGAFAGMWLDERADTAPLFLLFLAVFCLAGGLFRVHRSLTASQREDESPRTDR